MASPLPTPATPPTPMAAVPAEPEPTGLARFSARRQPVVVDAREWRIRSEMRANAVLYVALALFLMAGWQTKVWAGWATVGIAVVMLLASVALRPALPMRAPRGRPHITPEDAAVMTAAFPASPPTGWAAAGAPYAVPVGSRAGAPPPAARMPREMARSEAAARQR